MSTLEEFGDAFRSERRMARRTLREVATATKRSIGYLSDVEQGRKSPPPLDIVRRIEELFELTDGRLSALAEKVRSLRPAKLAKMIAKSPAMTAAVGELMRADGLTDQEMEELRNEVANTVSRLTSRKR